MAKICEMKEIPLDDLVIGTAQARLRHVEKKVDELAESIRKVGLLEPIVVCESETPGKYEIITGQRRFLAHQKLQKPTIIAAILDERVDEITAKVLSLTENIMRLDLNSRDCIDACTALYRRYGSVKAVAEETGLPYNEVSRYVKYDQLIPELKELVDASEVNLKTALRAQKAASPTGEANVQDAVAFAKEMTPMSGAQQEKIVKGREKNPDLTADQAIEEAKAGGKITQVVVTLTSSLHSSLKKLAEEEDTTMDDAARTLIEDGLSNKGFLEE